MTGQDVVAALHRGGLDPAVRAIAAQHYAAASQAALEHEHTRAAMTIRGSDAGRCVRELWAELHDKIDLEVDFITQATRFDIGTLYGAWLAAILKATLESEDPAIAVMLEVQTKRHGIPGHIDALITRVETLREGTPAHIVVPLLVVEFKSTYGTKNREAPGDKKPYQVIQATGYALDETVRAPLATVITIAPAAFPAEDRFRHDDYDPSVWEMRVDFEYDRLAGALLDDMPEGDPAEPWRCQGCRFSGCELNRNPQARTMTLGDLVG